MQSVQCVLTISRAMDNNISNQLWQYQNNVIEKLRKGYIEAIHAQGNISYCELFGVNKDGTILYFGPDFEQYVDSQKKICLMGNPKVGKTKLLINLLFEWAQGHILQKCKWMFKFDCETLLTQPFKSIEDVIVNTWFKDHGHGLLKMHFKSSLRETSNDIILIFDDINRLPSDMYNKIMGNLAALPCNIIITCRNPESGYDPIELKGLSKQGMEQFVEILFQDRLVPSACGELKKNYLKFFEETPILSELCLIPYMLKYTYSSRPLCEHIDFRGKYVFTTSYSLELILNTMWFYYLKDIQNVSKYELKYYTSRDIIEACNTKILFLEHFAVSKLTGTTSKLAEQHEKYMQNLVKFGFLNITGDGEYEMIHSIIEDYFVAHFFVKYLAQRYPFVHYNPYEKLKMHDFDEVLASMGQGFRSMEEIIKDSIIQRKPRVLEFMKEMLDSGCFDPAQKKMEELCSEVYEAI